MIIFQEKYVTHKSDVRIGRNTQLWSSLKNTDSHVFWFLFLKINLRMFIEQRQHLIFTVSCHTHRSDSFFLQSTPKNQEKEKESTMTFLFSQVLLLGMDHVRI